MSHLNLDSFFLKMMLFPLLTSGTPTDLSWNLLFYPLYINSPFIFIFLSLKFTLANLNLSLVYKFFLQLCLILHLTHPFNFVLVMIVFKPY